MKIINQQFFKQSLLQELLLLFSHINRRRQHQFGWLLILMIISSLSEVVSLGAVMPFLAALSNAEGVLNDPQLESLLTSLHIETTVQLVKSLSLLFIVAVIVANGLRILTINIRTHLAANISSDLSCELYRKTILQSYYFHIQHNSSDLINTVTGDTRELTRNILMPLVALITNSFVVLGLVGGLFIIDAQVATIAALSLGSTYAGLYYLRRSLLRRNSQVLVQSSQQQIQVVQESLGGIRDVLLGGTQSFFQSTYQESDRPFRHAMASNQIVAEMPRYAIEALAMTAIGLLALGFGQNGDFSNALPVLGSLALGANRLLPALQQSFSALVRIQGARTSLQKILKGLQRSVEPFQAWTPKEKITLEDALYFEDVWFRYSDNIDWVLQGLNLKINARSIVGLVGTTGSGKTTAADLILGLLTPQRGTIWVDNHPLVGEHLRQWQQSIAHVPQNIFLSDATIAENIAFGLPKNHIDHDRLYKAACSAQINEFIETLPAKYNTYVGERGVRLSGGQRQRIGIARALYRQASVIVFDEATSALDNETEQEVMAAINKLSQQFTVILIAHRLSTVERCDCIFELKHGKIIFGGTYKELLNSSR